VEFHPQSAQHLCASELNVLERRIFSSLRFHFFLSKSSCSCLVLWPTVKTSRWCVDYFEDPDGDRKRYPPAIHSMFKI